MDVSSGVHHSTVSDPADAPSLALDTALAHGSVPVRHYTATFLPRFDALHGIGGIYLLVLGMSLLILPQGSLGPWIGAIWLRGACTALSGLALLWMFGTQLSPALKLVLSVLIAVPQGLFAAEYARLGSTSTAVLLALFALGFLLAPLAPPSIPTHSWRPDALGLVLGAAQAFQGLDLLLRPAAAVIVPAQLGVSATVFGVVFLCSGLGVVFTQLVPGNTLVVRKFAHVLSGGAILALWSAQAALVDPVYWVLGAAVVIRGVATVLLPWLSPYITQIDRHAIRPRLALALITTSLVPLLIVIPIVLHAIDQGSGATIAVQTRQLAFGIAILAALTAGIGGWWLAGQLAAPLQALTQGVDSIARGERGVLLSQRGPTEVGKLGSAVVAMAAALDARAQEHKQLITQLQAQNEELRTLEAEREDSIRAISHDLRNPLTALAGRAQLLVRHITARGGLERELGSARTIVDLSARLNSMIQDLADSLRITAGSIALERTAIYLPSFISQLRERVSEPSQVERIQVVVPHDLPLVLVDPSQLERILTNLLSNALKYAPPPTPVVVRGEVAGDVIVVEVKDQGPGLTTEEQAQLFTRYHRVNRTHGEQPGLGLGLYVTRALIEAHGGRIWVESDVGEGTAFRFTLPYNSPDF